MRRALVLYGGGIVKRESARNYSLRVGVKSPYTWISEVPGAHFRLVNAAAAAAAAACQLPNSSHKVDV